MRNTPQRTRSYASPTRDKIFIWSAVVAGCGINHLSKEDLKHLGYNVGKFLKLKGENIALFIKNVFAESFGTVQVRTIIAKLADRNPGKDRIPLLSAKEINYLFEHYKRYKAINIDIIPKRLAEEEVKSAFLKISYRRGRSLEADWLILA